MKTVKVYNAKDVKVMKAGRKENRKSVLVVPEVVREKREKSLINVNRALKEVIKVIKAVDSRGVHYDHNINKNEK